MSNEKKVIPSKPMTKREFERIVKMGAQPVKAPDSKGQCIAIKT